MDQQGRTTNFAELAYGFLSGLNALSPLIRGFFEFQGQNNPPSALLRLNNPDKKIYINANHEPMVTQVDGPEPDDFNFGATVDAEMFHYIIWGRLPLVRAMNEKVVLIESNRSTPPEDQPVTGMAGGPLLFNNILYEMYLIRIGAGRLITDNTNPDFPLPGEQSPVRDIHLDPVLENSILGNIANALARMTGWLAGLIMRIFANWLKPREDLEAPLKYSTIPDPRPPAPAPSSGIRLAIMKKVFKRIDIFQVLENLAKGIRETGPLQGSLSGK
jgi:hypothetical protein